MTNKEALKYFTRRKTQLGLFDNVQQAENCAITALEKQIPKKPIQANYIVKVNEVDTLLDENEFTKCPSCTYKDTEVKHGQKYCRICGQALDWSDTE